MIEAMLVNGMGGRVFPALECRSPLDSLFVIVVKGVPGSECHTGGRLVGCHWSLEKKKMDFINFWPDQALLSTNVNYISSIYYIELKSTEIRKKIVKIACMFNTCCQYDP